MKKFLAIALIAASLTSCGGGKTEEAPATDSTTVAPAPADSMPAAPAVDTAKAADTTKQAAAPAENK